MRRDLGTYSKGRRRNCHKRIQGRSRDKDLVRHLEGTLCFDWIESFEIRGPITLRSNLSFQLPTNFNLHKGFLMSLQLQALTEITTQQIAAQSKTLEQCKFECTPITSVYVCTYIAHVFSANAASNGGRGHRLMFSFSQPKVPTVT